MQLRPRAREQIMRILLSALMKSDLSLTELKEFSEEASRNSEMWESFTEMLRGVVDHLDTTGSRKHLAEGSIQLEKAAIPAIARRRLSKKVVMEMMGKNAVIPEAQLTGVTIRDLVRKFFSTASASEARRFVDQLDSGTKEDPYLHGIMDRR